MNYSLMPTYLVGYECLPNLKRKEMKPHKAWGAEDFLNSPFPRYEKDCRIKPEPKPDVVRFYNISRNGSIYVSDPAFGSVDFRLIWDGETGALKDAEVLK